MSDLLSRLDNLASDGEWCSPLAEEAAARVRELEAERSAMIDNVRFARERAERAEAERGTLRADNERLRGLLAGARPYLPDSGELSRSIDAALAGEKP